MSGVTITVLLFAIWLFLVTLICMFMRAVSKVNERYDANHDDPGY